MALAALWKSWGVEPEAVVGHSVGEVAAAHIAGALRLGTLCGDPPLHRCMDLASSKGKMLAVGLSMLEAEQAIQGYEDRVASVAAINSPSSATLSGDPQALEQISQALDAKGVFCRFLRVNYAFHSPQMEPIQDELLVSLDGIDVQPTALPMISTVTGQPVEDGQCDKHYWWQNVRQSVRFAEAVDWLSERLRCLCGIESPPDPLRFGLGVSAAARSARHCAAILASAGGEEQRCWHLWDATVHPWASSGLAEALARWRPLRAFAQLSMAAPTLLA